VPGIVYDVLVRSLGDSETDLEIGKRMSRARIARELDYSAHLGMLGRIEGALASAAIRGVVLKGALLAERYYPEPAARATTDIDLLVAESDLERAGHAIRAIDYRPSTDPSEARFRREHHHLHFFHDEALPLELHFHAYRGFGRTLRGEPLVERSVPSGVDSLPTLRVLAPADELTFLAVHAAAHRFVRLGWLYDLRLVVDRMSDDEIACAARFARDAGFERPLSLAARLLVDVLGLDPARLESLGALDTIRAPLLRRLVGEPRGPIARSATRFAYTTALCDSPVSAFRYAKSASRDHVERIFGSR